MPAAPRWRRVWVVAAPPYLQGQPGLRGPDSRSLGLLGISPGKARAPGTQYRQPCLLPTAIPRSHRPKPQSCPIAPCSGLLHRLAVPSALHTVAHIFPCPVPVIWVSGRCFSATSSDPVANLPARSQAPSRYGILLFRTTYCYILTSLTCFFPFKTFFPFY